MPEHRTRGLVLRTFDHGESDRLVHLYTEALGRVTAIAKGARRSRRRFPGTLELFTELDLVLAESPRSGWLRVEAAVLEHAHEGLSADLGRFAIACELVELLDRCAGEGESNPELYRFALGVLGVLEQERPDRLLALLVATKTLARLGFRPVLAACAVCGESLAGRAGSVAFAVRHGGAACPRCAASEDEAVAPELLLALEAGLRAPLRERARLGLSERAVRQAESLLERFFRFHVGLEPRSREAVHALVAFRSSLDGGTPHGNNAPGPRAAGEGGAPPAPA